MIPFEQVYIDGEFFDAARILCYSESERFAVIEGRRNLLQEGVVLAICYQDTFR